MLTFVIKRIGSLAVVLFALATLVFLLQHLGSGDPVRAYLGSNASQDAVERTRETLGLNRPLFVQYGSYLLGLVQGDLGTSYTTKQSVAADLAQKVPATVELALWALAFAVVLALALSAVYTLKGRISAVIRFIFFSAASAPAFLTASIGLLVFFGTFHVLPAVGRGGSDTGPTGFLVLDGLLVGDPASSWDAFRHLVLPAAAASLAPGVALARILADGISGGVKSGYARTARSLGESEFSVVFRHTLRNASSPALSLLGLQAGMMLSSLVVVEQIFSWNGLGQYLTAAISASDFPAVAGVSLVLGALYVVLNSTVDVLLAAVDPRVRIS